MDKLGYNYSVRCFFLPARWLRNILLTPMILKLSLDLIVVDNMYLGCVYT